MKSNINNPYQQLKDQGLSHHEITEALTITSIEEQQNVKKFNNKLDELLETIICPILNEDAEGIFID